MNEAVPDLTPPTKLPKEPKAKKEKAVKAAKDPNAPAKARNPRKDYGYSEDAVIGVVADKDNAYRGKRKEWFDGLVAAQGQSVKAWAEGKGSDKDPARGWLRFFVQDGTISLTRTN